MAGTAPPVLAPPGANPSGVVIAADQRDGYTPTYDTNGILTGWKDANGVDLPSDPNKLLQPPTKNPDGSITYVAAGSNGTTYTRTSNPDGSYISDTQGVRSTVDASGKRLPDVKIATGQPLTPGEVSDLNNKNAKDSGVGGGTVTLTGTNPVDTTADALKQLVNQITQGGGGEGGNVDTAPVSAAAANAKALSDKFLADYNAAHPGEPPVANAAQLPPAVLAAMPPAIKAGVAAQGAPVQAGTAQASLIDPSTGLQFRQGQEGLIQTLNDAISGKAPSVAELQMKRALETNSANQLGLAAKASGGGNTFLALQQAANNIGHLNQQSASDQALLRAKEIMDARGQLGGVLDQARSGDINIGSKNAELGTGVSQTNATNTTNANSKTADLANAIATSNAAGETSANVATGNIVRDILQGNRDAANTRDANQGRLTTDTNIANAKGIADQRSTDEKTKADLAAAANTASGHNVTASVGAAQAAATAAAAKAQADAAKLGAVGAGAATLLPYIFGKPK